MGERKKLNIMMAANAMDIGGVEKSIQLYAQNINKNFFNISVCGIQQGGSRGEQLEKEGFTFYIVKGNFQVFEEILTKEKIDILHIHRAGWQEMGPIISAKKAKVPIIVETNTFGYVDPSKEYKFINHTFHISKTNYYQYCCRIRNRPDFLERRSKISVLYPPFDIHKAITTIQDSSAILGMKKSLAIYSDFKIIGRIGRNQESKFGDILIEMFPYLLKLYKNVKFVIAGIPESKKKKIEKMGFTSDCIFLEQVKSDKEIYSFYHFFDVLVHSSRMGESCSGIIAEAMACGKPIVTNSTPDRENGQIEQVDHGITGFIANYPKAYAHAVYWLLTHQEEATKMGDAGQKKAKKIYEASKNTRVLEKRLIKIVTRAGMELDPSLLDYANTIEDSPSQIEVDNYESEYRNRLKKSFERNIFLENWYLFKKKFKEKFLSSKF